MYIAAIEMVSPAERLVAHEELQPFTSLYDAEDDGLEPEQMSSVRALLAYVVCCTPTHTPHTHTPHTHAAHCASSQQRAMRSRLAHGPESSCLASLHAARRLGHRTGSDARFGLAWLGPRGEWRRAGYLGTKRCSSTRRWDGRVDARERSTSAGARRLAR